MENLSKQAFYDALKLCAEAKESKLELGLGKMHQIVGCLDFWFNNMLFWLVDTPRMSKLSKITLLCLKTLDTSFQNAKLFVCSKSRSHARFNMFSVSTSIIGLRNDNDYSKNLSMCFRR